MATADTPAPAIEDALHTTLEMSFEDAVGHVQLEHELQGFETVKVTRLDRMIEGMLDESVARAALVIVCHPEIARDTLEIDRRLASLLPCTTIVYEPADGDDAVHVHHLSVTKAIQDLGGGRDHPEAVDDLVASTGELMGRVWETLERLDGADDGGDN